MQQASNQDRATSRAVKTALLSAADFRGDGRVDPAQPPHNGALPSILGVPFLTLQIRQLHHAGIQHFLLEVEQVTGAITAIADELQHEEIELSIIRSAKDIGEKLPADGGVLVMAPGVAADMGWLSGLIAGGKELIVTLPNKENAYRDFEIINLHNKWAGVAIVDAKIVTSLGDLPDGWSLPSAILREALGGNPETSELSDEEAALAGLGRIADQRDADLSAKSMLDDAAENEIGAVEKGLFSAISPLLLLKLHSVQDWAGIAALVLALFAAASAFITLVSLSAVFAIIAIFLVLTERQRSRVVGGTGNLFLPRAAWLLILLALLLGGYQSGGLGALFAAIMVAGLSFAIWRGSTQKPRFSDMESYLCPSPAFLGLLICVAGALGMVAAILQAAAIYQLLFLCWRLNRG